MREHPIPRFRPALERLEPKQPLAAGAATAHVAHLSGRPPAVTAHLAVPAAAGDGGAIAAKSVQPKFGFLVFRLTNPSGKPNTLTPPFGHVLLQDRQPIPGQQYNILQVAVKNETQETFDASSDFLAKFPGQKQYTPILTGNEQWKPGQDFIFYVLTKKYYPLQNQVTSGFLFKLGGAVSTAIPGPSGIFLRITYNPATINKILDFAVTRGPGAEGGKGIPTGMADTAIYGFTSGKIPRNDYGGYF